MLPYKELSLLQESISSTCASIQQYVVKHRKCILEIFSMVHPLHHESSMTPIYSITNLKTRGAPLPPPPPTPPQSLKSRYHYVQTLTSDNSWNTSCLFTFLLLDYLTRGLHLYYQFRLYPSFVRAAWLGNITVKARTTFQIFVI